MDKIPGPFKLYEYEFETVPDFQGFWWASLPGHGKHRGTLSAQGVNRARINLIRAARGNLTVEEVIFLQHIIC